MDRNAGLPRPHRTSHHHRRPRPIQPARRRRLATRRHHRRATRHRMDQPPRRDRGHRLHRQSPLPRCLSPSVRVSRPPSYTSQERHQATSTRAALGNGTREPRTHLAIAALRRVYGALALEPPSPPAAPTSTHFLPMGPCSALATPSPLRRDKAGSQEPPATKGSRFSSLGREASTPPQPTASLAPLPVKGQVSFFNCEYASMRRTWAPLMRSRLPIWP